MKQSLLKRVILGLILGYQRTLSPDHGWLQPLFPYGACKFHPTCSQYAYTAVEKLGIARGLLVSIRRILRCHPWSRGGFDPVK